MENGTKNRPGCTESGWVIEKWDSEQSRAQYFTGAWHPAMQWSDPGDSLAAMRFARKQDAEKMAINLAPSNQKHRIVEHAWEP